MLTVPVKAFELLPVTVTFAVPDLAVSSVEVAFTVNDERVSAAATVSKPLALIVVPEFLPVSTIVQVTVCAGLLVPVTVAVNCCVPPLITLTVEGLTVTLVTVGVDDDDDDVVPLEQAKDAIHKPASAKKPKLI
jgi:hypothetical protein